MPVRADTFGGQLLHFARSVDIVSDSTMESVRSLINRYVKNGLGAQYFEFMREQLYLNGEARNRLTTRWSSTGAEHIWEVQRDGGYTNAVTMSFDTDRPLCLVGANKAPLDQAITFEDKWSHVKDVQTYRPTTRDQKIHTLIAVPVHYRRKLGIYYVEASRYIDLTEVAKEEFRSLSEALGILLELWYVGRGQSECTRHAIDELSDLLQSARFPKMARPHLFLAFSERADAAVMRIISNVLDEFSDKLEYTDWSAIYEAGNISAQITREIAESSFGICYLSEPGPTEAHAFVDNPNVLFEAGMLHARTSASVNGGGTAGWIPVREVKSPAPPFDLAGIRILLVPRDPSGKVHESAFRDLLIRSIKTLIKEPGERR